MNVTISSIQITDQGAGTMTCSVPDGELLTIRIRDFAHWMEICHAVRVSDPVELPGRAIELIESLTVTPVEVNA